MNTIQDILYAKALADASYRQNDNTGMAVGAIGGTALGALAPAMQDLKPLQQAASYGRTTVGPRQANATTNLLAARGRNTGRRLAGSLVGAIVGGALGEGVKQIAMRESPAANMLAKIQAQGGMSMADEKQLELILRDLYNGGI